MKRLMVIIAVVVVAVGVVAAAYWWSQRHQGTYYDGLASRFPDKVQVYVEIAELGQWMTPSVEGDAAAAQASARGTDPMLQVLGQVWAAQPVKPAELPDLLRRQPMAVGIWKAGESFKGVALMTLAPGQAKPLEKFLKEKLGAGEEAGAAGGMSFHKATEVKGEVHLEGIIWGVSDAQAIIATSLEEAKAVMEKPATPLSKNLAFVATLDQLKPEKGALCFVQGAFLADLAKEQMRKKMEATAGSGEKEEPSEPPKEPSKESPKPPDTPAAEPPKGEGGEGGAVKPQEMAQFVKALSGSAQKVLAPESLRVLAVWTAPPEPDRKGWVVRGWLGLNQPSSGMWRIVTEGSPAHPDMVNRVPKDAQIYIWGGGKDPARIYQLAMEEINKDLPPDQAGWVRAGVGAAEGKAGFSFANDLLPTLGDEWCMVADKGDWKKMGFFIALRDSRRFEDLIGQKLAPQFKLKSEQMQGARVWSWSPEGGEKSPKTPSLVVSGGMAILTTDPGWALTTGSAPGKAYEKLQATREKVSGIAVIDPTVWSKSNEVTTVATWRSGSDGVVVDARFPGDRPNWGKSCCDKPCDTPCDKEGDKQPEEKKEPSATPKATAKSV